MGQRDRRSLFSVTNGPHIIIPETGDGDVHLFRFFVHRLRQQCDDDNNNIIIGIDDNNIIILPIARFLRPQNDRPSAFRVSSSTSLALAIILLGICTYKLQVMTRVFDFTIIIIIVGILPMGIYYTNEGFFKLFCIIIIYEVLVFRDLKNKPTRMYNNVMIL